MNTPHALTFHDLVSYSLGLVPDQTPANVKRNGVYFPNPRNVALELVDAELFAPVDEEEPVDNATIFNAADIDDDYSTWEFNAPVACTSPHSWRSDAGTCTSPYQTPAQDVAFRYRAGLKVDLGERSYSPESLTNTAGASSSESSGDYTSSFLSLEVASTMSSVSLPLASQQPFVPIFRESRANALLDIREEALAIIRHDGLGPQDPVVCHRPGCRDTLSNMKALMYHLHVHNMYDKAYKCDLCRKRFETRRNLDMHQCPRLPTSLPSSPIRDTFMRVLTRITSRE